MPKGADWGWNKNVAAQMSHLRLLQDYGLAKQEVRDFEQMDIELVFRILSKVRPTIPFVKSEAFKRQSHLILERSRGFEKKSEVAQMDLKILVEILIQKKTLPDTRNFIQRKWDEFHNRQ
jgi:hypothetical protein